MRSLWMAGLAGMLAACATSPVPVVPSPAPPQVANAQWSLQGRIAVKAEDNSLSGQLRWRHGKARDELLLSSPLGQGIARIVSDDDGVLLEVPKQPPRRAPDAETLTHNALGMALPLAGLRFWVEGRPDPARPSEQKRDDSGRINQIRQDGWTIDYLQYMNSPPDQPRKLVVARGALEVRLVIDTWQTE